MLKIRRTICVTAIAIILSGCASIKSIKIPDFDFIKFPEFKEEATNIPDYPNVANAPKKPTDIRSDGAWDSAAQNVMNKRDGFAAPDEVDAKTDAEVLQEMQRLRSEVDEYKKDDPQ